MAESTRQPPTIEDQKELARRQILTDIQNLIEYMLEQRKKVSPETDDWRHYGYHLNRLIEAKRWVNFLVFNTIDPHDKTE